MEKPGKIAFGATNPWVDYSGPVGEGWDGIALFDHPSNPGYPSKGNASEYGLMSIAGGGYPQDDLHRGGAVTLRCRAYVHEGDAEAGRVEAAWHDYAHPCLVIPGEIRQVDA